MELRTLNAFCLVITCNWACGDVFCRRVNSDSKMFECDHCNQKIKRRSNFIRHLTKHETCLKKCKCKFCDKTFSRRDARDRHVKTCSSNPTTEKGRDIEERKRNSDVKCEDEPLVKKQRCDACNIDVVFLHNHFRSEEHKRNQKSEALDPWTHVVYSAFKNRIVSYSIFSENQHLTPQEFMESVRERVLKLINHKLSELGSAVKINLELFAEYAKYDGDDETITQKETMSFNTTNKVISVEEADLKDIYNSFADKISTGADDFEGKGSGWALVGTVRLELNINKFAPIKGSSYMALPKWIQVKRACVNVQNKDNACFAWAVLSALHPVKTHTERESCYHKYRDELNLEGVTFPMSLSGIKQFEKQNDISINVFEISGKKITGPLYHTKKRREKHVNLLLIEDGDRQHYCWIKNMSKLVGSQISKHEHRMYVCDGCLLSFSDKKKFTDHIQRDCKHVVTSLPSVGHNILKFKNWSFKIQAPVVVYADFEALVKPVDSCSPSNSSSYTYNRHFHEPYSFGYYIKCSYDNSLSNYFEYRGKNCADMFFTSLKKELAPFVEKMKTKLDMNSLTQEQEIIFESAEYCHICHQEFRTQNITQSEEKVRDHDHLTGEFRGAAHSKCNLNYKIYNKIPIVIHNLSGYDAHFIIKALQDGDHVTVIAKNKENYTSFTVNCCNLGVKLRFIDSFKFMSSSLSKLAKNLPQDQLKIISAHFPRDKVALLSQKGVFPYEYTDCWEKLDENCLPPKEAFYSSLTHSGITDEEYDHAQTVWKEFDISTLGEYSDIYLKTDVLLLAEVFENFREVCLGTYHLDPAHYFTAPGLSWDAMLKHTAAELELLTDDAMVQFISRGIRGGLSQCSGKYALANNKDMEDYDLSKESSYIVYLDANNLYGWAMSQHLPVGSFRWLKQEEVANFEEVLHTLPNDSRNGYYLEVDLEYPPDLHDLHNDLPFCPENKIPEYSTTKTKKLIADFHTKRNYVIHYRNLKQCLEYGLKLIKIHRILSFKQSQWLKPYIDLNTKKRTEAQNSFEKDFYKLMNNAVFGKTMENVEKYVDVRIVRQWESDGRRLGARALISRINFHSAVEISEDTIIIQMKRNRILYNKPTYIGFSVLDISKTLMYEFHYNYMQKKYGDRLRLLYTDTDSLIYEIKTKNFYEDIRPDIDDRFDTSDLPPDNRYSLPLKNKKVLGLMKDEANGEIISEFIGVRSKCYFVRKETEVIKKIKGIKKKVVDKDITGDDFYNCVSEPGSVQYREMCTTRSHLHDIYSQMTNKIALKNSDDKRFVIPGRKYETLALGHKNIEQMLASSFDEGPDNRPLDQTTA